MMNVATVFDRACPFFIILRQRGTISVCMRKVIAAGSLSLTRAPITPKDVTLKFSKIFVLVEVLRKGYKKRGIWARIKRWLPLRNSCLVWWCKAKHCSRPTTRQILLELTSFKFGGGDNSEYTSIISCRRMVMVPTECHRRTGKSVKVSLFRLSWFKASSRFCGSRRFLM